MKRLLALFLLSVVLLTSCISFNNETPTETPTDAEPTTPVENETTTVPDDTDTTVPDDMSSTVPDDTDTTVPGDTDTTVPDDTDTAQPPDIPDKPITELAERVQSVEFLNKEGANATISIGTSAEKCDLLLSNPYKTTVSDGYVYRYFVNTENRNVVLKISDADQKVSEILVFPERISAPTHDDFHKLEPGMALEEVIFTVGIPNYTSSDKFLLGYFCDNDTKLYYHATFEYLENRDVLKIVESIDFRSAYYDYRIIPDITDFYTLLKTRSVDPEDYSSSMWHRLQYAVNQIPDADVLITLEDFGLESDVLEEKESYVELWLWLKSSHDFNGYEYDYYADNEDYLDFNILVRYAPEYYSNVNESNITSFFSSNVSFHQNGLRGCLANQLSYNYYLETIDGNVVIYWRSDFKDKNYINACIYINGFGHITIRNVPISNDEVYISDYAGIMKYFAVDTYQNAVQDLIEIIKSKE